MKHRFLGSSMQPVVLFVFVRKFVKVKKGKILCSNSHYKGSVHLFSFYSTVMMMV